MGRAANRGAPCRTVRHAAAGARPATEAASDKPCAIDGETDGARLINLERYPIDDSNSPTCRRLVDDCRAQLRETGVAVLSDLVRPEAAARMAEEMAARIGDAYFCQGRHNAYLKCPDLDLPDEHPRNLEMDTEVGSIAWDRIGPGTALRQLYLWDPLVRFVGAVLEREPFYRFADPLGACSVNVFRPGMGHGWHFDEAEYTTSLMLQKADAGGEFEYAPFLRPRRGEDYEAVGRVLAGDESKVRRLKFEPGTLSIFHGRRALHRVTRCEGKRDRLVAILCFASEPNAVNSDTVRKLFWGRTQ